jgi:hypothetical protein
MACENDSAHFVTSLFGFGRMPITGDATEILSRSLQSHAVSRTGQ